ncbi:MAG: hypothetical protein AAF962_12155 [Actinomycetota bacterium]
MSDDTEEEIEESMDEEFEEDFEAEDPDAEAVEEDDLDLEEPIEEFGGEDTSESDDEEDEDEEEEAAPRARKVADDDEEDDDEEDDDVEADLEAILRDRLATEDDEEEEEGEEGAPAPAGDSPAAARTDEFVCPSCFLLVSPSQIVPGPDPLCPHCGELLDL